MTEGVPEQEATLRVTMDALRNLPNGAKYREESGRTSVEAERRGKNIIIRGKCDSITRRCIFYQNEALERQSAIDSLNSVLTAHREREAELQAEMANMSRVISDFERKRKPPNLWYVWIIIGAIGGSWLSKKLSPVKNLFKP